jgi:formylglycine-generating enzyme
MPRPRALVALPLLCGAATLWSGCQVVGGYETFERSEPAPVMAPAARCELLDPKEEGPPPALVPIRDPDADCFWMDETEVTVGQYEAWLDELDAGMKADWNEDFCPEKPADSKPLAVLGLTAVCKVSPPRGGGKPLQKDEPIRCVDWCEADAYCRSAGKRLCKGSAPADEWAIACSAGYAQAYPFDLSAPGHPCTYDQTCSSGCGPLPAAQDVSCRPSPTGPLNLGGNVEEWVDDCSPPTDEVISCGTRGGSYRSSLPQLSCLYLPGSAPAADRDAGRGFRCCADLTVEERTQVSK